MVGALAGTFRKGQVIVAASTAGSTGPQLLYQATEAGHLPAYVDGQDTVRHAGPGELMTASPDSVRDALAPMLRSLSDDQEGSGVIKVGSWPTWSPC